MKILDDQERKNFAREIKSLGEKAYRAIDRSDFEHLKKIEWVGWLLFLLGLGTSWMGINLFSIVAIALSLMVRWLLMHHISHGGYDKVPGIPKRYTSKGFAVGWRRYLDWFDWIEPKAWSYEHNYLHHYYTGEPLDPDIPERNATLLQKMPLPYFLKYILLTMTAMTWKFTYYAANTLNGLYAKKEKNKEHHYYINQYNFLDFRLRAVRDLWFKCLIPYSVANFILLPCLFLPLGKEAAYFVLLNRIFAEFLTNLHTFIIIVTNHAGEDVFRYSDHYRNKEDFYLRQVIGSVNFTGGNNLKDFFLMYLNYQIEHHVFPDLPMKKYREMAPEFEAVCKKYEVPYIKENVFVRLKKLYQNMSGKTQMKSWSEYAHS